MSRRFTADVKRTKRTTYLDAGFFLHARSQAAARERFAFLFDVPSRWVRVRRA